MALGTAGTACTVDIVVAKSVAIEVEVVSFEVVGVVNGVAVVVVKVVKVVVAGAVVDADAVAVAVAAVVVVVVVEG